jgi:GT2 family glycosyltransferase
MLPICIPTLNRGHDRLQAFLETALRDDNEMLPSKIVVLDNGRQFPNATDISDFEDGDPELIKILSAPEKVILVTANLNMGVGASWNWFLNNVPMEHGAMLICNDDITFQKETMRIFSEEILKPEADFVLALEVWAAFGITEKLHKDIGGFDENFYPAYFEDNDYHYRMGLKGYKITYSPDKIPLGHENSSTLAAFDEQQTTIHHQNFRKNRKYYNDKWGGLPTHEKYTTPFGK